MNDTLPAALDWLRSIPAINTLFGLMILDILCGLFLSVGRGNLSSSASWKGMSKKAITLLIVLAAGILQNASTVDLPLAKAVSVFYCVSEMISILENAAAAGVPLPKQLVDILIKLKQDAASKATQIAVSPPVVVVTPRPNESANKS